jgi:hypothetical protein
MVRMKILIETNAQLAAEGRWDLDYHLPAGLIEQFPADQIRLVADLATVSKLKRDPSTKPDTSFHYVDISSVDVVAGVIANPSELTGEEAPSRARMVIRAFDVIVSTCRPTRGAIAIVPPELHGEICSTGFTVLRAKDSVNPYYLHYVLRLASTAEQWRKFSTGSSYPAILVTDVLKTRVPGATADGQDEVARSTMAAFSERARIVAAANAKFADHVAAAELFLKGDGSLDAVALDDGLQPVSIVDIAAYVAKLDSAVPEMSPRATHTTFERAARSEAQRIDADPLF